jgi:hypothetical protein
MSPRLPEACLAAALFCAFAERLLPGAEAFAGRAIQAALFESALFLLLVESAGVKVAPWVFAGMILRLAGALIPSGGGAISLGAVFLLTGVLREALTRREPDQRLALGMAAFGLVLAALLPWSIVLGLGPEDGVRLRMLRLARVAAIAVPLLLLLYPVAPPRLERPRRWGLTLLRMGALTMAPILAAAGLTWTGLKYLLPLPADTTLAGAGIAAWLAWRSGSAAERAGWSIVSGSMAVGLLVGGFAFDGPLAAPAFLGAYGDGPRWLLRQAHVYAILLGFALLAHGARRRAHAA